MTTHRIILVLLLTASVLCGQVLIGVSSAGNGGANVLRVCNGNPRCLPANGLAGLWWLGQDNLLKYSDNFTVWQKGGGVTLTANTIDYGTTGGWMGYPFSSSGITSAGATFTIPSGTAHIVMEYADSSILKYVLAAVAPTTWTFTGTPLASDHFQFNEFDRGSVFTVTNIHISQGPLLFPYVRTTDLSVAYDLSGYGANATLSATKPTWAGAGLSFNGSTNYASATLGSTVGTHTIFGVVQQAAGQTTEQHPVETGNTSLNAWFQNDNNWYSWGGSTNSTVAVTSRTAWNLVGYVAVAGTSVTGFANGAMGNTTSITPTSFTAVRIGSHGGTGYPFNGNIALVGLYSRAFGPGDVQALCHTLRDEPALQARGITLVCAN